MKQSSSYPKFAVVGHPNKGKSSIVSAMARDDSIQIGDTPGTTQISRAFPLKVDGETIYELFDTPGFQRARRILAWLKKQEPVSADKRADLVKMFISQNRDNPRFKDEIELLEPIVEGAGIIYVVDASKPYGSEYEVEMEILRWTGKPSMAILNLIGDEDYRKQWKRALGHYFRLVRTFNPMEATFRDHIELLESMAQLQEEWTKPIKRAIEVLETLHQQKIEQSIDVIVDSIKKSLSYVYIMEIDKKSATKEEESHAKAEYQKQIIKYERKQKREIERIWNHKSIDKIEDTLLLDDIGLFSKESASIFGLSQKELIVTGASAGALGGLGIDIALGGGTLFLASLIGGAVGGVGAMIGFDNLYDIKVLGKRFGKRELRVGPMKNLNFPYIMLGRSLYHASVIANRSHAQRDSINLKEEESYIGHIIDSDIRKKLERVHIKFRKAEPPKEELIKEYREALLESFLKYINI
jgi:GTPase Era involved in 16S rRNA processing